MRTAPKFSGWMQPPVPPTPAAMTDGFAALTDKEKQTLRLIVRGHDAKSIARELDLSVHTINERLRDARRKLSVPSSREAARLLLDREGTAPEKFGDSVLREARPAADIPEARGAGATRHRPVLIGGALMSLALALLAALAAPTLSPPASVPVQTNAATARAVEAAARDWLALLDRYDWAASYAATGTSFRELNTLEQWSAASEKVRRPLGAVRSRVLLGQESVPAPPDGVEVVKFRTSYANRADVTETVSLAEENGRWRIVGVYAQ
jgi:DNA-binding CsgD family transcriptional regulator